VAPGHLSSMQCSQRLFREPMVCISAARKVSELHCDAQPVNNMFACFKLADLIGS